MAIVVCVQILNEPVELWREIPAQQISDTVYILEGYDLHDPDDECWEFTPGTSVYVEERVLGGLYPQKSSVAVRIAEEIY